MEEKKTLILGAAGFIGTNLCRRLLEKENGLLLFDRPGACFAPFLQKALEQNRAQAFYGSFSDLAKEGTDQEIDALHLWETETVYHLVSTTCPSNSNRDVAGEMEENLIATIRFLDACQKAGVKKVVFLSSGGTVYGREHHGICREEEEAFPITSYGVQKLAIEKILYLYREMYGLDYRIVRLSNPYGPWQRPNGVQGAVTTFTYRAIKGEPIEVYGDGSVVRDYLYIDDAVRGILQIAQGRGRSRLYNLGCGKGHTLLDVIEAVETVLGKKPEVRFLPGRPVDVPVNVLDVSRYEADFGPLSPLPLTEGIRRLAEFYRKGGLVLCR